MVKIFFQEIIQKCCEYVNVRWERGDSKKKRGEQRIIRYKHVKESHVFFMFKFCKTHEFVFVIAAVDCLSSFTARLLMKKKNLSSVRELFFFSLSFFPPLDCQLFCMSGSLLFLVFIITI